MFYTTVCVELISLKTKQTNKNKSSNCHNKIQTVWLKKTYFNSNNSTAVKAQLLHVNVNLLTHFIPVEGATQFLLGLFFHCANIPC